MKQDNASQQTRLFPRQSSLNMVWTTEVSHAEVIQRGSLASFVLVTSQTSHWENLRWSKQVIRMLHYYTAKLTVNATGKNKNRCGCNHREI